MEGLAVMLITIVTFNLIKGSEIVAGSNIMFLIMAIIIIIINAVIRDREKKHDNNHS